MRVATQRVVERDPGGSPALESRIRWLVAEHLGVSPSDLLLDTSLADDLAVDSLDLLEIAIAIETHVGVSMSERCLGSVRTYGDLAFLVTRLVSEGRRVGPAPAPPVMARVMTADRTTVQRTAVLTPYEVETIADDAIAAGPGARLEVAVRGQVSPGVLDHVRLLFARLGSRGIRVQVHADPDARLAGRRPAA